MKTTIFNLENYAVMTDEHYMKKALNCAEEAYQKGEVPVGAIIVIDNKIVARGHNQVEMLNDCTAHAEIIALTSAFNELGSKYLPEATIYITVEPCLMCCGALHWSKIGRIVYGASDPKNGYLKYMNKDEQMQTVQPFHPKTILSFGTMAEECALLMKDFFKERR